MGRRHCVCVGWALIIPYGFKQASGHLMNATKEHDLMTAKAFPASFVVFRAIGAPPITEAQALAFRLALIAGMTAIAGAIK